jgi:hypothetical protein
MDSSRNKKSCSIKRELYIKTEDSNDPRAKERYKIYCKILSSYLSSKKVTLE